MGFFSSLFGGGSDNSPAYSKNDSAQVWPAKFLAMAITEVGKETVDANELRNVIGPLFPYLTDEDYSNVAESVADMNDLVLRSSTEWDDLWDNFCSQLSDYKNSESFEIVRIVSNTSFSIKMVEEMEEVAENFVYRFAKHLEKYTMVSKADLIAIMEEEKENSGYNNYLNNLG